MFGYLRRAAAELLIDKGADTTLANRAGETALDVATRGGFADIVALLEAPAAAE